MPDPNLSFGASASPKPGFSFGATTQPTPPPVAKPPDQVGQGLAAPSGQMDSKGLFDIFARMLTDKQDLGSRALGGRHLGIGGAEMSPGNPTGEAGGSPWAQNGLFHGGFASQMSPEALAKSHGADAVNQWNGVTPTPKAPPTDAQQGTVHDFQYQHNDQGMSFADPFHGSQEYDPRFDRGKAKRTGDYDSVFGRSVGGSGGGYPR